MKEEKPYSIISKPGAGVFFTWIALSAAIFFGAYSVRIMDMYDTEVSKNNELQSRDRELSFRLELASAEIKKSATTLEWSNVEVNRLRAQNDEIEQKVVNMRRLLYAAIKRNQTMDLAEVTGENEQELTSVSPKASKVKSDSALDIPEVDVDDSLGEEIILPELTKGMSKSDIDIKEIVKKSSDLRDKSSEVVAKVLTYNPSSKKVFINLGRSNAEVEEGNRFAIWRNGKHVTDIRIAQVHSVTSTCEVISPVLVGIRAGDVAEMVDVSAF